MTFIASQISTRSAARQSQLDALEQRDHELEAQLKAAQEREATLTRENIELLRQVALQRNVRIDCPLTACPLRHRE